MEKGFSFRSAVGSWGVGVTALTLVGAFAVSKGLSASVVPNSARVQHVPGELVVKLRDAGQPGIQSEISSVLSKALGSGSVLQVKSFETDGSLLWVQLARDEDLQAAIRKLGAEPSVEIAEPNYVMQALETRQDAQDGLPNDPEFAKTWGLHNVGQVDDKAQVGTPGSDIQVVKLWQAGVHGSRKIVVAVIDTGVDLTHPDLKDNIYTNIGEIPGNGVDDDTNGFVDDVHGMNFAKNATPNANDDNGHGSHVAGTIGAVGNNGVGVAGVNWEVSILPVKFLDAGGSGSLKGAIESINYARIMKVQIMSNSWGGGSYSQAMEKAIQDARDAGILFVAAAGNDSSDNDGRPAYPASYNVANVVSVAATDNRDQLASFSNYGAKSVHVAAPGVRVFSTYMNGKYETLSGTSMATPHVSGIAALLLSANGDWDFAKLKERMILTSDPVRSLKRKVLAKGRVNTYNAINNIVPPSTDPEESQWQTVERVIESEHKYKDKANITFTVTEPGAKFIRVHFEKIEVEKGFDHVLVESPSGEVLDDLTGTLTGVTSEYVAGDTLVIRLRSDASVNGWGFKVDKVQFIP